MSYLKETQGQLGVIGALAGMEFIHLYRTSIFKKNILQYIFYMLMQKHT